VKELAGGEGAIYAKNEGLLMPRKRSIKMIKLKNFLIMAIIKLSLIEMDKKDKRIIQLRETFLYKLMTIKFYIDVNDVV